MFLRREKPWDERSEGFLRFKYYINIMGRFFVKKFLLQVKNLLSEMLLMWLLKVQFAETRAVSFSVKVAILDRVSSSEEIPKASELS